MTEETVTKFMDEVSYRMSTLIHEGITESQRMERANKAAAWDLYVELMTRIYGKNLELQTGREISAITMIYILSTEFRDVLKRHGRACAPSAKIVFTLLNKHLHPFAVKWQRKLDEGYLMPEVKKGRDAFNDAATKRNENFLNEWAELQAALKPYIRQLAEIGDFNA